MIRHAAFWGVICVCSACHHDPATAPSVPPAADHGETAGVAPAVADAGPQPQHEAHVVDLVNDEALTATSVTLSTAKGTAWTEAMQRDLDPTHDGWETEKFSEHANKQLKRLGTLMVSGKAIQAADVAPLVADAFVSTPLRPNQREPAFSDQGLTIERAGPVGQDSARDAKELADALNELTAGLADATDKYFKFKLFGVKVVDEEMETRCLFEISGRTSGGTIQRNATWNCRWQPGSEPRLLSIRVEDYEEVEVHNPHQTLFTNVTDDVLREASDCLRQFRPGIDHWRGRLESYLGIYFDGLHGLAVGDVNGDGLDDLYVCEPGGLPNRLLIQTPDGRVQDRSAESGVNFLNSTRSALLIDLDHDGDQDLVMPMERRIEFFVNDGQGHFTLKASLSMAGQTAYSLAAADYDHDGDLDVYACAYHGLQEQESNRLPAPIPLHDARTGGPNRLFRNEGAWEFNDVTNAVGLDHHNDRWSYAAVWEDYDNDGDMDLYVANDFGRNNLYRNDGQRFEDVAASAGAEDMNFGMSAAFADYNRDGWMDLYVSNMFSAAGGRITFQPGFQTDHTEELKSAYQRMARGNTLLQNRGDGTFQDVSETARVTMGRWAWGSLFADINNDGWEDLVVANGFVTGSLPGDL